jgi:predicted ester cyclase
MKKTAFLGLAIFLILAGCVQKNGSDKQLEELLTQTKIENQNKVIAQKILDGLNQKDISYAELYAPECEYYFPSSNQTPTTREDDINASRANWNAMPDIRWVVEELIADGDWVVARFTVTGTQSGEWLGIPPTNKVVKSGGIVMLRIVNGKVVEQREEFDVFGSFMQLGMELKPAGHME